MLRLGFCYYGLHSPCPYIFLYSTYRMGTLVNAIPSHYKVVYTDGTKTRWLTGVSVLPGVVTGNIPPVMLEEELRIPGTAYMMFNRTSDMLTSLAMPTLEEKAPLSQENYPRTHGMKPQLKFTSFGTPDKDGNDVAGYAILQDFLVLKLESFRFEERTDMVNVCNQIREAAKAAEVSKLMIDLTNNIGGYVALAYDLVICLYPDIAFEDLSNLYDAKSNPASQFFFEVISSHLTRFWELSSSASVMSEAARIASLSSETLGDCLADTKQIAQGLWELLGSLQSSSLLAYAIEIESTAKSRQPPSISAAELGFLTSLVTELVFENSLYEEFNGAFTGSGIFDPLSIDSLNRGGQISNYTSKFMLYWPTHAERARSQLTVENPFQSYLLLSNGASISSAETFAATAYFYAKQSERNVTPFATVCFGGSGNANDCPFASVAGGTVDESDVSTYYTTYGGLKFLSTWFGGAFPELALDAERYLELLPEVPYFAAGMPSFSMKEMYLNSFGPDALPLEYYDLKADHYLKQWWMNTQLDNGSDLKDLYDAASRFFP